MNKKLDKAMKLSYKNFSGAVLACGGVRLEYLNTENEKCDSIYCMLVAQTLKMQENKSQNIPFFCDLEVPDRKCWSGTFLSGRSDKKSRTKMSRKIQMKRKAALEETWMAPIVWMMV